MTYSHILTEPIPKGQGFCPVNFFTGHGQIWTRVQEWTRVQDPTCPVKKFTGHKLDPFKYILCCGPNNNSS